MSEEQSQDQSRQRQWNIIFLIVAVVGVLTAQYVYTQYQQVAQIPYSKFESYLDEGRIKSVDVGSETIRGEFDQPVDGRTILSPAAFRMILRSNSATRT